MKYELKKKKRSKLIYILPISIIAACIVVCLIVMNIFGFGKSGGEQKAADAKTETTESQTESATETTTVPQNEHTNPMNAKEAEALEASSENRVYLTFDDGPSANTDEILDILKKNNIKATFFILKSDDPKSIARMKRMYDEGHTVAMHSVSHEYPLVYADLPAYKEDVDGIKTFIDDTLGIACKFYRFPGG